MRIFITLAVLINFYFIWDSIKKIIKNNKKYERDRKPS